MLGWETKQSCQVTFFLALRTIFVFFVLSQAVSALMKASPSEGQAPGDETQPRKALTLCLNVQSLGSGILGPESRTQEEGI